MGIQSVDDWKKNQMNATQTAPAPVGIQPVSSWLQNQPPAPPPQPGIASRLLHGAVGFVKTAGQDVARVAATPALKFDQALLTGVGMATGNKNLVTAANEPIVLPHTGGATVAPQKNFGQGGAKQIAGQALEDASYLVPAGRAEAAGASLFKGDLAKGLVSGAIAGATYGGLGGAGSSLQSDQNSFGNVAKQTAIGTVTGAAGGFALGLGGAALARTADKLFVSKTAPEAAKILTEETKLTPEQIKEVAPKVAQSQDVQEIKTVLADANKEQMPMKGKGTITPEASDLIAKIDQGGSAPAFVTQNLKKLATDNGIKISDTMTPNDVIDKLRAKEAFIPELLKSNQTSSKTSGVAKDINTKAIEQGLTSEYKDLATYEPRTIKEQAQKISDLIAKDPEDLGRIVRGEKPVPEGMSPSYLVTAADKYATKTKDAKLLQDLVSSKLTGEGSQHASELSMLGQRDQSSAMKALKQINDAKAEATKTRSYKTKTTGEINKIREAQFKVEKKAKDPTKNVSAFIDSITC